MIFGQRGLYDELKFQKYFQDSSKSGSYLDYYF